MTETLATGSFATLDEALAYLTRDNTAPDKDTVAVLLNNVVGVIRSETRRALSSRAYGVNSPLIASGDGSNELLIPEWPVTALVSVTEIDGLGATRTVDITNYRVSSAGVLWVPNDAFTRGYRNLKIQCTAGYTLADHPDDFYALRGATLRLLQVALVDQKTTVGRGSGISLGGDSFSTIDVAVPKDIARVLSRYARMEC